VRLVIPKLMFLVVLHLSEVRSPSSYTTLVPVWARYIQNFPKTNSLMINLDFVA